jgi:hypothetical protein
MKTYRELLAENKAFKKGSLQKGDQVFVKSTDGSYIGSKVANVTRVFGNGAVNIWGTWIGGERAISSKLSSGRGTTEFRTSTKTGNKRVRPNDTDVELIFIAHADDPDIVDKIGAAVRKYS